MTLEYGNRSSDQVFFDEAWLYCACLFHNGTSDWRMLTLNDAVCDNIPTYNVWIHENERYIHQWPTEKYYVLPVREVK